MKKLIYLLFPLLIVSCEGMLDEVPKDFISKANYYTTEEDAEGAIAGAYSAMGPDYFGIDTWAIMELHGDYINGRGSQAPISVMDKTLDATNINRVNNAWTNLYKCINRANAVIDNVSAMSNISDEARSRIVGEAHFLRALCYFDLVRGWGGVPLRTSETTGLDGLNAPRAPISEVYDLIIEDATIAEASLPETVGSQTGRASKWAAKMLLSQIYLTLEDWSLAAEKADDVINSGEFSLVTVSQPDDFYLVFGGETSSEDIFSIHHSPNRTSFVQTFIHKGSAFPYNYSSLGYYAWLPNTASFIGASWNDNDLRKSFNLYTEHQDADGNWVPVAVNPVLFKKYRTDAQGLSVTTLPVYRYAEALLLYAEASARAAGAPSDLALERLNMIKRRAYGYDPNSVSPVDYASGMSEEQFVDTVLQERAYEFLLERRRWWDLLRTGKAKEAFAAVGKTLIDARLLWPIPHAEIDNNAALSQEDQNPGY